MAFTIRRGTAADREHVLTVLREYHPDEDTVARHAWLYDRNPHGPARFWLALDDASGEVAGMTAFFARRMWLEGETIQAALGGDGFVRPGFRRRGLGRQMHAASRADMGAAGIRVMFGTPMPANLTPLTQVGAITIGQVARYVRPLRPRGRFTRFGPAVSDALTRLVQPRRHGAALRAVRPLDPAVDAVWAATRAELRLATIRDAAFYEWRFRTSPSQRQRPFVVEDSRGAPIAACALEHVGRMMRIVDLVAPRRHWSAAIGAIAAHALAAPVDASGVRIDSLELRLVRQDALARDLGLHMFFARDAKPLNVMLPPGNPDAARLFDARRYTFTAAETDMDHA